MEGKGIVKFFLVVLVIVCAIQFFYFIPTNGVENDARRYAEAVAAGIDQPEEQKKAEKEAEVRYLDSISNTTVFSIPYVKDFTYQELKSGQLAFGLDLKGGMNVILQVDLRDFIRALANNSKDPTFTEALENANKDLSNSQSDFITLFGDAFKEKAGGKKLAEIFSINASLRDEINVNSSDGEVLTVLRNKADETVKQTFKLLRERIDKLGVVQPNITLDETRDIIVVELPGVQNPERARKFLKAAAKLDFWDVYRVSDGNLLQSFVEADKLLERKISGDSTSTETEKEQKVTYQELYDSLGNVVGVDTIIGEVENAFASNNGPLLSKLSLNAATGNSILYPLPVFGTAPENERDNISKMLEDPSVKNLFPRDAKFVWSRKSIEVEGQANLHELYVIKNTPSGKAPLEGDKVTKATPTSDPNTGNMVVSLTMNQKGAKIWGKMTTEAARDNRRSIAILLDNEVVSAPSVNEPILSGSSQISGGFTTQEAQDLSNILQIGKLPAKTKIIQESLVGPSLGQENIDRSMNSLAIGFCIVLIFMILYYGKGGIVSIIALFLNLFFILGSLSSVGTVLSLAGVAGIVLTIGMAVDANVIIYERIREELREGKMMATAIADGFKNSYSAIIDANVTTILTAFVLAYFGIGPIKGFAIVLIIGVLSSLFTAVLVGRLIIEWYMGKGNEMTFFSNFSKNAFADLNIDWYGMRKKALMLSGLIILIGLGSMLMRGFDLGVDFKGGYSYNVQFDSSVPMDAEKLRAGLSTNFVEDGKPSSLVIKAVSNENTFNIVTDYLIKSPEENADEMALLKLHEGISALAGGNLSYDSFKNADGVGTHITSSTKVGPTIADDIMSSSIKASVFALLLIFLYLLIRFPRWTFSAGAVAALVHDVLVVLSIFSLLHGWIGFSMEVDQAFIAAVLTVIGYSINDTVVVFDRIREVMNTYVGGTKGEILNRAINSTVSRTIITSVTTLFVVFVLFLFGGASIKGFAFALLIGIIVGTYSSVFIAAPVMAILTDDLKSKEKATVKVKKDKVNA